MDRILHAGDIGGDDVLVLLESIAPLTAVRGNMDHSGEGARLRSRASVTIDDVRFVVQHGPFHGRSDAVVEAADVLVHGHTHRPVVRMRGEALLVNPGSPSANRDRNEGTVALVTTGTGPPSAHIIPLAG